MAPIGEGVDRPHPRMVHVWALKVAAIPLLLVLGPWLFFLRVTALPLMPFAGPFGPVPAVGVVAGAYLWAGLYWTQYRWRVREGEIHIWRGILFRKRIAIPHSRMQNVNVVRGPLLLLFGLSALEVETAGERGHYGYFYRTEGYVPGLKDGESLADDLIERAKAAGGGAGL